MLRFSVVVVVVVFMGFAASLPGGPHFADINVLLPPKMTFPVYYQLHGTGGCFNWSWDHHDFLSLQPDYKESRNCSISAQLRSIAPYSGRKETAVYACDVITGIVIRIKVYIDIIFRLKLEHTSVKLDVDGLGTLRVLAFDREENLFSSLVGLQFLWQLMPEIDGSAHHLVHVPLRDSPWSDCGGFCGNLDLQIKLENSDAFSDLTVVKGIESGHEIVSVHLLEPQFHHLGDKIVLNVAEAMSLVPASRVLLVGALVQYHLKITRGNLSQAVPLPSPFHRWSASNSSVAQVDAKMGVVCALNLGATRIIVEDTRVAGHTQISSLNVALPDYLSLYSLPLSKSGEPIEGIEPTPSSAHWYVVSGRRYLIELKVLSQGPSAQEVYITKNEDVKLYYDQPEHWKNFPVPDSTAVKHGWQNSRILEASSQGLGWLLASLTYSAGHPDKKEVLTVVQEVDVCDQVMLVEEGRGPAILLPWSPDVYQKAELKAIGGCANSPADYIWLSSDTSILSVSATGVVQAKRPGKAIVQVFSVFDSLNFAEVAIDVSVPSFMVMLPHFPVETVVGSHLQAAVTMKAANGDYFYQCDAFCSSVKWSTGSESFIIVSSIREAFLENKPNKVDQSKSDYGSACAWTYLYAASPDRAILEATFSEQLDPSYDRQIVLKAHAPIASFWPLIVRQAGDGNHFGGYFYSLDKEETHYDMDNMGDLYLAPGSYLDIKFLGGPERWGEGVDFIQTVDILDELGALRKDEALILQRSTTDGFRYRIFCQVLGNFVLVFKRGNLVGDDHPQPVVAEAKLRLTCSFPFSIVVLADEPVNTLGAIQNAIQADRGPGHIRSMPITVANGRTIRVAAVGISNSGKVFANSSSVPLRWELNNCDDLALWDDTNNFHISISSWERYLALKNASGLCNVHAMAQNYLHNARGSSSSNVLTDAIHLQIVSTLQVFPEFAGLFFNPDSKSKISVGAHITPQNAVLHPWTYLNSSFEGLNDQASGRWLSADESVLSVDSLSGKATANGEGTTLETFQSPSMKRQTMEVPKGKVINVNAPRDILTNILPITGGYNFSVKFSTDKLGAPSRNIDVPYDCEVDPSFIGYAKPWKDPDSDDSYCLFFPYPPEYLVHSVSKSMDKRKDIPITIHATLREANDVSGSASALFIGGFSILDMNKLNLTPDSNTSIVTVVGNTDVHIHWLNRDLLTVRSLLKEGSGVGGRVKFEVSALKAKPFKDRLVFTLPASGQRVELDVMYGSGYTLPAIGQRVEPDIKYVSTLFRAFQSYLETLDGCGDICKGSMVLLVIIILSILATLIFVCIFGEAPPAPRVVTPTPVRRTDPRKLQTFIEYVRRTANETPYQREVRRRIDPT